MIKKQNGEMQESVNKDLEELKNKHTTQHIQHNY